MRTRFGKSGTNFVREGWVSGLSALCLCLKVFRMFGCLMIYLARNCVSVGGKLLGQPDGLDKYKLDHVATQKSI